MHRPERARSMFVKANILRRIGHDADKAGVMAKDAARLLGEVTSNCHIDEMTLTEEDFDQIVMFWTR
ncbi:hypothetical protein GGS24DRAFT_483106 [Hypoxylon argillaceum]|nr:hypothetical protein GGS24DRAFT_483106 [Hypoxylon argillaceum]